MNTYEKVTEKILDQLKAGTNPWRKPWVAVANSTFNRISKKNYSLLNRLLLSHEGEYATFKQWQSLGGKIRSGEKAETVVFWKMQEVRDEIDENSIKLIPILRHYSVFHISQVDGVEPLPAAPVLYDNEPIDAAEKIVSDYVESEGLNIRECFSNQAYYSIALDEIVIPCKSQYSDISEYYSTLFHEMVHSTGHSSRLNRELKGYSSDHDSYSKEELVAEIGSAFLMDLVHIQTPASFMNSAAYLNGWIKKLEQDNRLIVSASSRAEKAVAYITKMQAEVKKYA